MTISRMLESHSAIIHSADKFNDRSLFPFISYFKSMLLPIMLKKNLYFFNWDFFLKVRMMVGGGWTNLLCSGSPSTWSQSLELSQAATRSLELIWIPHIGGRGPSTRAILSCLPKNRMGCTFTSCTSAPESHGIFYSIFSISILRKIILKIE